METTVIIILSLMILYLLITMLRDNFKRKWYRRGYLEASIKYNKEDYSKYNNFEDEANEVFEKDFGFHYD